MSFLLLRYARQIAGFTMAATAMWSASLPAPNPTDHAHRARAFEFERRPLAGPANAIPRSIRRVHPSLQRIAGWISAVGASVALADLDGDGLPNEVCLVDPRFDEVRISAADPAQQFAAFAVRLDALPYDARTMAPTGCLPGDFNEDGLVDFLVYFWGRTPMLFLQRAGSFGPDAFEARELIESGDRWFTNAATRTDLDGDGHADLVFANYFPDGARILDAEAIGEPQTMQHSMTRAANGGAKHFFLWAGATASGAHPSVTFHEVDPGLGPEVAHRWTLALGAADLDRDLLPELYFANDFGPDVLLHNLSTPGHLRFMPLVGRRSFWMPASKTLGRDSFKGMGVDFGDLNGDGIPDIFVSNIAAERALEESHFVFLSTGQLDGVARGIAPYVDDSEEMGLSRSGWAWDAKLDDFDNDGVLEAVQATGFLRGTDSRWPELQELATGNDQLLAHPGSWPRFADGDDLNGHSAVAFFARHADGRYYDLAEPIGLGDAHVSRGIAIADIDGDGRLDIAIANQWDQSYLYRNRAPSPGAFIGLHLRRPLDAHARFEVRTGHPQRGDPSTLAVGATVQLWRDQRLVGSREVDSGNGHSGRRSGDLHFGLGDSTAPVRAVIRWRGSDGTPHDRSVELGAGWYTVELGER